MNVLPDPVAICASARGRFAFIDASTLPDRLDLDSAQPI